MRRCSIHCCRIPCMSHANNCRNEPCSSLHWLVSPTILSVSIIAISSLPGSRLPVWALAMPLILLAGQDLARLFTEFHPPNRELPASRARFAPLFGALLFHGLAIGTVFVAHAQMAHNRLPSGGCAGCGGGGGGCGSGCCGEPVTAAKASSGGCGCGAKSAAPVPKAGGGCGCGSAPAGAPEKPASGGCGCGSGTKAGAAQQGAAPSQAQLPGGAALQPQRTARVQGPMVPPNRTLNTVVGVRNLPANAQGQRTGPARDAKAAPDEAVKPLPLPAGLDGVVKERMPVPSNPATNGSARPAASPVPGPPATAESPRPNATPPSSNAAPASTLNPATPSPALPPPPTPSPAPVLSPAASSETKASATAK